GGGGLGALRSIHCARRLPRHAEWLSRRVGHHTAGLLCHAGPRGLASPRPANPFDDSPLRLFLCRRLTVCHSASSNPLPLILHICGLSSPLARLPPLILPLCSRLSPLNLSNLISISALCGCAFVTLSLCECDC
ncbi:hypothetical protein HAX54_038131, partial [Datura stramonium]|nr:hypothetical protein [Datura stramonium]